MVEKARTMARKLEIPPQWKSGLSSDGLSSPTSPLDRASPRGWRHRDAVGGVGLGILAALEAQPSASAAAAVPKVSGPVSIARRARLEVSELGCSGRCATSLCGGGGGGARVQQKSSSSSDDGSGRPGSPGSAFRVAEFLSCCGMCRRALDGKDIFMYRGERAFCSTECRYHAIVSDEFQEEKELRKRRAAAAVSSAATDGTPRKADMAGSPTPCSGGGGQIFTTGIVAA